MTRAVPGISTMRFWVLVAIVLTHVGACSDKAAKPRVLGELVELLSGQANRKGVESSWSAALPGATFVDGEALRTDAASEARLKFAGELLRMGPETTIYFGSKKIDFEGEIEVGAGLAELGIDFGEAEVTTTGTIKLTKRDASIRFEVLVGEATITERGQVETLEEGQQLVFELGTGTVEKITRKKVDAGMEPSAPDAGPDAGPAPIAPGTVTATVAGKDVRARGEGEAWVKLVEGDHQLAAKTELELKGRSSVVLARGDDTVTLSGPSQAVISDNGDELVELRKGRAAARSQSGQVVIAVPGGSIQLHAGKSAGNAQIEVGRDGALTKVVAGRVTLRAGDVVDEIRAGESAMVSGEGIDVIDRAPTDSHITLNNAGDATLHADKTPMHLRVDFKKHCERATVQVARGRSYSRPSQSRIGEGSAILSLGSGSHRYRVLCYEGDSLAKKPVMEGKVTVKKDSGSRPLPPTSPENSIDADGRRYTVLFQNRPPALRFRWPKAPPSKSYQLQIVPARSKAKTSESSKPEKEFKSGVFGEGDYEYWFVAGSKESKRSHLTIAFDNAAATGYLSSPKPSDKIDGSEVRVAGAAVSGWKVFVGDKELSLDGQFRFDEMVPVSADGVAVRFTHPRYGTHYYLRRK